MSIKLLRLLCIVFLIISIKIISPFYFMFCIVGFDEMVLFLFGNIFYMLAIILWNFNELKKDLTLFLFLNIIIFFILWYFGML